MTLCPEGKVLIKCINIPKMSSFGSHTETGDHTIGTKDRKKTGCSLNPTRYIRTGTSVGQQDLCLLCTAYIGTYPPCGPTLTAEMNCEEFSGFGFARGLGYAASSCYNLLITRLLRLLDCSASLPPSRPRVGQAAQAVPNS